MNKQSLLDDTKEIGKIDQAGMLRVIADFPVLLSQAVEIEPNFKLKKIKNLSQIVVCGMGGSAIAGNIIAALLAEKLPVPVIVNRNYGLPTYVDKNSLIFAVSYSGNTEETLSAVKEAMKKKAKIVCFASGGKLAQIAQQKKLPFFQIPAGYQPRAALPLLLGTILVALGQLGFLPGLEQDLAETIKLLEKLKETYSPETIFKNNPAKQMAVKLAGKTAVVLATTGTTEAAGLRFKTQLNENSKTTALLSLFPELNHNEIVNLAELKQGRHDFCALILRSSFDSERIKKRIKITKSIVGRQIGDIEELEAKGKSLLRQLLSLILLGDFVSAYLAITKNLDPTPVEAIERLKRELKR